MLLLLINSGRRHDCGVKLPERAASLPALISISRYMRDRRPALPTATELGVPALRKRIFQAT